jgi:hypothetical protein
VTQRVRAADAEAASARVTAAVPPAETPDELGVPAALVVFVPLFAVGVLLLGVAAVPPARIRWNAVSMPLYYHRSNLAAIGIGTIVLALLLINAAVLL